MPERDEDAIRALISRLNRAVVDGQIETLNDLFDLDAVIVQPAFNGRVQGQSACVDTYRQFIQMATIHDFDERDHTIDLWGDTAVASYRFVIDYEIESDRFTDAGHDLLVLKRTSDAWRIIWRTVVLEGG